VGDGVELGALRVARFGGVEIGVFFRGVYLHRGGGEIDVCWFDRVGLPLAVALVAAVQEDSEEDEDDEGSEGADYDAGDCTARETIGGGGAAGTGDGDNVGLLGGLPGALGEGEIFAFVVGC